MAKIAVELENALASRAATGAPGCPTARPLAQGSGWTVDDVICTSGPQDRTYEEQHSRISIAIVAVGTFQYRSHCRSGSSRELMFPGSLLLGNAGQTFECEHKHGTGDRCVSFHYTPDYFEHLAADAGASGSSISFPALRLPPLRALSPLVARACAGLTGIANTPWQELSIQLAAQCVQFACGRSHGTRRAPLGAEARVARIVRMIEHRSGAALTLDDMAREAVLSPYHFLRTFQLLTGVTPHQYLLRARLRNAAIHLIARKHALPSTILDVAFDCGFGDVSNFNRAFRAEFGVSPRAYLKLPN